MAVDGNGRRILPSNCSMLISTYGACSSSEVLLDFLRNWTTRYVSTLFGMTIEQAVFVSKGGLKLVQMEN